MFSTYSSMKISIFTPPTVDKHQWKGYGATKNQTCRTGWRSRFSSELARRSSTRRRRRFGRSSRPTPREFSPALSSIQRAELGMPLNKIDFIFWESRFDGDVAISILGSDCMIRWWVDRGWVYPWSYPTCELLWFNVVLITLTGLPKISKQVPMQV